MGYVEENENDGGKYSDRREEHEVDTLQLENVDSPADNVDLLVDELGNPGRFQMLQFVLLSMQFIACAMCDLAPIFYDLKPHKVLCDDQQQQSLPRLVAPAITSNVTWWDKDDCSQDCPVDRYIYHFASADQWSVVSQVSFTIGLSCPFSRGILSR